jgi:hypothetical protein
MICLAPNSKCVCQEACALSQACVFTVGHIEPSCETCKGLLTEIEVNEIEEVYCKACDVSDTPIESDPFSAPCEICGVVFLGCGFPGLICPSCLSALPIEETSFAFEITEDHNG